jgi:pilus assembly protein CpaB
VGNRIALIVVAVVAGFLAVVASFMYLSAVRQRVEKEEALVRVYVAAKDLARNASAEDLIADRAIETKEIPRKYIPDGAIASAAEIGGKVLVVDTPKGAILTRSHFASVEAAGMPVQTPPGFRAVAIEVNEITAAGKKIVSGDRVDVVASFDQGPNGKPLTKTVLQNVLVLQGFEASAAQGKTGGGAFGGASQQQGGRPLVILALAPADIEKLLFSENYGAVWLTLRPARDDRVVPTGGQTIETVVK